MDDWIKLRIASTQAELENGSNFFVRGLPPPEIVQYHDHSNRRGQSRGGVGRFGYPNFSIIWASSMSVHQSQILDEMILTAEQSAGQGNGTLFFTIPKTQASTVWIDVSGIVERPNWGDFVIEQTYGKVYQNIRMNVNNVKVVAEPSTVTP